VPNYVSKFNFMFEMSQNFKVSIIENVLAMPFFFTSSKNKSLFYII
jgi:hypothetical protein